MRAMRKVIAERMHASLQEMAQLTMAMEVVMDDAVKLYEKAAAETPVEAMEKLDVELAKAELEE